MTTHIQLIQGDKEGLLYGFDKAGEGLMMHDHGSDTAHTIKVLSGEVLVHGEAPSVIIGQGESYDLDWAKKHEVVALEDQTVIFNEFINGIPKEFRNLPLNKRSGSMEDTLHNPIPYHTVLGG